LESPLGRLRLVTDGEALVAVDLPGYPSDAETGPHEPDHPVLREASRQLEEYFAGRRRRFELPLRPHGTTFQRKVWRALEAIPFGATRSYADLARAIGRPTATRAVGAANGRNPLAIIVPCHRVIGADGSLTGYGGGLPAKRWLLAHEAGAPSGTAGARQRLF
jgi:methylated-DNA-[protein]-cysteine S-methyltransferase